MVLFRNMFETVYNYGVKVKHRETGEVMVVKQLLEFDTEAQESFLKEVRKTPTITH